MGPFIIYEESKVKCCEYKFVDFIYKVLENRPQIRGPVAPGHNDWEQN